MRSIKILDYRPLWPSSDTSQSKDVKNKTINYRKNYEKSDKILRLSHRTCFPGEKIELELTFEESKAHSD